MAVNIIETTGTSTFENVHHRSDRSAPKGKNELTDKGVILPRFIYSKLGNWTEIKNITVEHFENEHNEFEFFIMQMQRYTETGIDDGNIAAIDEYLGSLGVDTEYPFDDDTFNINLTDVATGINDRNIIYNTGSEIVNIVYHDEGLLTNVVHDVTYIT